MISSESFYPSNRPIPANRPIPDDTDMAASAGFLFATHNRCQTQVLPVLHTATVPLELLGGIASLQ